MICPWQFVPAPASESPHFWLHGETRRGNEKSPPHAQVPYCATAKIPELAQAGADGR